MNVFSGIRPRAEPPFPYRLPQLCVFLQLTDAVGEPAGRIVARKAAGTGAIVFASTDHVIRFWDRLQDKWVVFRLKDCPFPEPGLYCIEFQCDGQVLGDQRVRVWR
jgi:hypothetical protein